MFTKYLSEYQPVRIRSTSSLKVALLKRLLLKIDIVFLYLNHKGVFHFSWKGKILGGATPKPPGLRRF